MRGLSVQVTLADLQLAIGTGALPVHLVLSWGFPDRSLALGWGKCPQSFQRAAVVSLMSSRSDPSVLCSGEDQS